MGTEENRKIPKQLRNVTMYINKYIDDLDTTDNNFEKEKTEVYNIRDTFVKFDKDSFDTNEVISSEEYYKTMFQLDNELKEDTELNDYTSEYYIKLQQNIIDFKNGDTNAARFIIKAFHKLLTKYTRFISLGQIPRYEMKTTSGLIPKVDKGIVAFVGLYISRNVSARFVDKRKRFLQTCVMLRNLFKNLEYAEVYNELVIGLMQMVNVYKILKPGDLFYKPNGSFPLYVRKCFHYYAKKAVERLIYNSKTCDPNILFSNESEEPELSKIKCAIDEDAEMAYKYTEAKVSRQNTIKNASEKMLTMKEPESFNILNNDVFNYNWINGITCNKVFSDLNNFERKIIILLYIKKYTIEEAAIALFCRRMKIIEYKRTAIEKIKKKMQELNVSIDTIDNVV